MLYTRAFVQVLSNLDFRCIKFFDESGFSLPDVCNPRYGRAPKGERAVEVGKKTKTANITLNLMIGSSGVAYANIIDGPSNMDCFIDFFFQAINATTNTGEFALKPGDFVVLDNCALHHNHAEHIIGNLLAQHGIEYIFLPTYSPHLNPVELCFQYIKSVFKSDQRLRNVAKDNLHYAIMNTVNSITAAHCYGYYTHVQYLNTAG